MSQSIAQRIPRHRKRSAGPFAMTGFTLMELMIVLVIVGILVSVGIPTFSDATLGSRLGSTANNLVSSLYLARSEAIKRNTTVRVCPSTDGTSCASSADWEGGWIVIEPVSNTVLERQGAVSGGILVRHKNAALSAALSTNVDMPATGIRAGSDEAFLVCRATPSPGLQERVVSVSATGRPSVKRTETGSCS